MNTAVRVTVGPCPQGALVQWLPTAKRRTVLRIRPWSDCPVILVLKPKGLGLGMLSYLFISASHTNK